jgi:ABC-2 type transport system ATP-binding protein
MMEARGLAKRFGQTLAVAGIDLEVHPGEILGFLGPNGAGKTTTLRMVTGFLRPSAGEVRVAGRDVAEAPLEARRQIGYLPENAPLYEDMMVVDFLRHAAVLREVPPARRRAALSAAVERCGLGDVLGKDVRQLSKGFRQRVGLAQAMIHDPALLILDEPTSGLDPNQIAEIRSLIRELGREKTVILSTHILPEVQATCDRIVIIADGRLVADDTPAGLAALESGALTRLVVRAPAARAEALVARLGAVSGVAGLEPAEGEGEGSLGFRVRTEPGQDPRAELFAAVVAEGLTLLELHREQASLEATFRRLTLGEPALPGRPS